jgi:hypothetical protein
LAISYLACEKVYFFSFPCTCLLIAFSGSPTYAFFENHLQAHLATNGKSGLQYAHQPGLYSVKRNINVPRTSPKWLMIFPPIEPESMSEYSIDRNTVFIPNKIGQDNG